MLNKKTLIKRAEVVDLRKTRPALRPSVLPIQKRPPAMVRPVKRAIVKRRSLWPFLIGLLFLIAVASGAGFWFFGRTVNEQRSVKAEMTGPNSVVGGEEISFEINYTNIDQVTVENIELAVTYPKGFYFNSADLEPYNPEKNLWRLPSLPAGQTAKLKISGQLFGAESQEKDFSAIINYQLENFKTDFQENVSYKVKIERSLLDFDLTVPAEINDGATTTVSLIYKNNQATDVSGLNLEFYFPEKSFLPDEATAKLLENGYKFSDLNLASGEEKTLTLSGKFNSGIANPMDWSFRAFKKFDINGAEQERDLIAENGKIAIKVPDVKVSLERTDGQETLNWGKIVGYKINFANSEESEIKIKTLKLTLNDLVDWAKIILPERAVRENSSIVWSFADDEKALIKKGENKEFAVSAPLLSDLADIFSFEGNAQNMEAQAELTILTETGDKTFASEVLSIPLVAAPQVTSSAKYYNDQKNKVGSGPLPPIVDKKTTYRIYWRVLPGSNGLTDFKMETTLPDYAVFDDFANQPVNGQIVYDSQVRKLVWTAASLGAFANDLATFDVAVTPVSSQFNQLLILTNASTVSFKEKNNNKVSNQTLPLLTSELLGDAAGSGYGGRVTVSQ